MKPAASEQDLLDKIIRRFAGLVPASPAGIGDDAAVLPVRRGPTLASTDCLIESVHFRRDEPPTLLGRKALAVNLSDLAAMGGRPHSFLLTLAIPPDLRERHLDGLLAGLAAASREHGVSLIGGNISRSPGPLMIAITILGTCAAARGARRAVTLTRSGARPEDGVYVGGPLGGSAAGRILLEAGWRPRLDRRGRLAAASAPEGWGGRGWAGATLSLETLRTRVVQALRRHLDPTPRLALGQALLARRIASAAIDLSDGLSIDLSRLCDASGVGARILAAAVPIADSARALAPLMGAAPLGLALGGGEDYELLFTVPRRNERRLKGLDAILVGRILPRGRGLLLADPSGRDSRLRVSGHDHLGG